MRLWPDTLAGRTLLLLAGMTAILILGSALLLRDERAERFDERNRFLLLERVTHLVQLLDDADEEERARILARIDHPGERIELAERPWLDRVAEHPMEWGLQRKLQRKLRRPERAGVRVRIAFSEEDRNPLGRVEHAYGEDQHGHRGRRHGPHALEALLFSIRLWDGVWLNLHTRRFEPPPPWAGKTLQLLGLLVLLLGAVGLFLARRMARPMAYLAQASERFGLGRLDKPLEEKGPREVRETIRAFNQMQARLNRHLSDRARLLAAISHDLRTPITTLRLRAEYIEDPEMREKTLATLAEMEAMVASILSFARDEAAAETSRATNLAALTQSVVDERVDLGGEARYRGPDRLSFECRPMALKRALNNVVDNALKYGGQAEVSLEDRGREVRICVEDRGPGIPSDRREEVFKPFVRLETSRNRDTGGTGLGLAVARSVLLAHGGDIALHDRPGGGLRCELRLPRSDR